MNAPLIALLLPAGMAACTAALGIARRILGRRHPGGEALELAGRAEEAAEAYRNAGQFERAARLYEQLEDPELAGHLFFHGGLLADAERCFRRAGWAEKAGDALRRQAERYLAAAQPALAAECLARAGDFRLAAELYPRSQPSSFV